jgi:hypothetical protein
VEVSQLYCYVLIHANDGIFVGLATPVAASFLVSYDFSQYQADAFIQDQIATVMEEELGSLLNISESRLGSWAPLFENLHDAYFLVVFTVSQTSCKFRHANPNGFCDRFSGY